MKTNYAQPSSSGRVYRRVYGGFRGVDFANPPTNVDITRSPYAENVYTDATGHIHKRYGYELMYKHAQNKVIHSIHRISFSKTFSIKLTVNETTTTYSIRDALLVHEGNGLYVHFSLGYEIVAKLDYAISDKDSRGFQQGDKFYLFDQDDFWVLYIDDETMELALKRVYEVATPAETQIAGYYYAEEYVDDDNETAFDYTWTFGEEGEKNLLTARRINTFCGDEINTKFYFDSPNFEVYKVELYAPSAGVSAADGTVTMASGTSNVRNKPSMDGVVVGYATTNEVYTCLGMVGNWYKIVYKTEPEAYVHKNRVATYTPPAGASTATAIGDWTEIPENDATYAWEVAEATTGDDAANCTKLTFKYNAPPAHPRGNGLPNIRVTGAVTEFISETRVQPNGAGQTNMLFQAPSLIRVTSITVNGTAIAEDVGYTITKVNGIPVITVLGIDANHQQQLHSGDTVVVNYRRESREDIDMVGHCLRFGRYGEYNTDRYFYTGNGDYPNRDWYSEPGDPTLVYKNSYTDIGNTNNQIAGYLNFQGDMLIVKYDGPGENLFRRTATTDGDMAIFPVKAYEGRGAVNDRCLASLNGQCFYLSPDGLYEFVSTDLNSKYAVQDRDLLIRRAMIAREIMDEAALVAYPTNGWLMIAFSYGTVYVADTNQRTGPSLSGSYGFEWFYWPDMPMEMPLFDDGYLWFAKKRLITPHYKLVDLCRWPDGEWADYPEGRDIINRHKYISAMWQTPFDQLDEPALYKYIERRGMMLQMEPDYTTDPSQGFEMAIIVDGNRVYDNVLKLLCCSDNSTAYDLQALKALPPVPSMTIDKRISRFKYIQFIFKNESPICGNIGVTLLEFQYRYGRAIIQP